MLSGMRSSLEGMEDKREVQVPLKVVARVRANTAGISRISKANVVAPNAKSVVGVPNFLGVSSPQVIAFWHCFFCLKKTLFNIPWHPPTPKERAFEVVGKPLLEATLQGLDASCICYGQVAKCVLVCCKRIILT